MTNLEAGKATDSKMERSAIEKRLVEAEASIASAETAAEEQSAQIEAPETGKQSDMLVELLIARLLRVAYRDNLSKSFP